MKQITCPRCDLPFDPVPNSKAPQTRRSPTRDHILPRNLGGTWVLYEDVRNDVIICAECNQWRGTCGHCWGAAACVDAVARDTGLSRKAIYRKWGMGYVADELLKGAAKLARGHEPRVSRSATQAIRRMRTEEAVQIGMAVSNLGVEAFRWPAQSEEDRLHNYRALLRGGYKPKGGSKADA